MYSSAKQNVIWEKLLTTSKYYNLSSNVINNKNNLISASNLSPKESLKSEINKSKTRFLHQSPLNGFQSLSNISLSSHLQAKSLIKNPAIEYGDPALRQFILKKKQLNFE